MSNSNSSAVMTANPLLSEALYHDCVKFACRIIHFERCNLYPEDIVHDLIIEIDLNYGNYQKKIRSKILSEKYGFKPLSIESVYYKTPLPFKTNQDFTCTKCKDILPDSERKRYFSSKGFYVEKNTCKKCSSKQTCDFEKKARLLNLPYWFRKLQRNREYYKKNNLVIRYKRKVRYYKLTPKTQKLPKVEIDWAKEKIELSNIYICRLLKNKFKNYEITAEIISQKRHLILNPNPKKDIKLIRAEWNEKRNLKYKNDLDYKEITKKKVSEYAKANNEKRRQSKLNLKLKRVALGF